jgi:hypothetical protein
MGAFAAPRGARERPSLIAPRLDPFALWVIRRIGPAYVKAVLGIRGLEFIHGDRLVRAFRDFQARASRLLIAFRHPYGDEPQLLSYAIVDGLPKEARRLSLPLSAKPHAVFIHGYEVPLWSDAITRWILPRSGAMPVYHARLDSGGMERIRKSLADGPYPLALAPEGQSSYHSEAVLRLEGGTMRLARWCAGDLAAAGRKERVEILPVSIHCRFEADDARLDSFIGRLEERIGARGGKIDAAQRLLAIFGVLLSRAEAYYRNGFARASRDAAAPGPEAVDPEAIEARRAAVMRSALERGEAAFGLEPRGDHIDRVYRIRQEGWDRIFPVDGLPARGSYSRALADRRAAEAWHASRHMELVDLLFYMDARYLDGSPSRDRRAEFACNLADLASRLLGGNLSDRKNPFKRRVVMAIGEPIRVGPGRGSGPGEADLRRAYEECIREYQRERKNE